jgi:hypothetical protein
MSSSRELILDSSPCDLALTWNVDPRLTEKVFTAALLFQLEASVLGKMGSPKVWIISGARTKAEQDALRLEGRPTAREEVSTHRTCPATGMDISLGSLPTLEQKVAWGRTVMMQGLRWGGGSPLDGPAIPGPGGTILLNGIPSDWQHVDLGPR